MIAANLGPWAHEEGRQGGRQEQGSGHEDREGDIAHPVEAASDNRLQAHEGRELQARAGHHVDRQHRHRHPDTTTIGPQAVRPHGPFSAATAMSATKSNTETTTDSIGIEKRHHGMRLARKVEAGTEAAQTARVRTQRSTLRREGVRAELAPPDEQHDEVGDELAVGEGVEERRHEGVDLVAGLVVVDQAGQPCACRLDRVARGGVEGQRGAPRLSGTVNPRADSGVTVRSCAWISPAWRVEVDCNSPGP